MQIRGNTSSPTKPMRPKKARGKRRTEESYGLSAVQQSVIIGKSNDHDGSNDDLAVDDDGLVFNRMHT